MKQQEFIHKYFSHLQSGNVQNIPPITVEGDLNLEDCKIKALPDNLTVTESINVQNNKITILPKNLNCCSLDLQGNPVRKISLYVKERIEVHLDDKYYDIDLSNCDPDTVDFYFSDKLNLPFNQLDRLQSYNIDSIVKRCLYSQINWNQLRSRVFHTAWEKYRNAEKCMKNFSKALKESWFTILRCVKINLYLKVPENMRFYLKCDFELKKWLITFVNEYRGCKIIKRTAKTFTTKSNNYSRRYSYDDLDFYDLVELPNVQRLLKLNDILSD
jgi:hypothetical protein